MNRLVEYSEYFRGFDLEGVFIVDDKEWKLIKKWCKAGKEIGFGEIGGKHSDVRAKPVLKDFKVLSTDQDFIAKFREILGDCIGVSVLDYMVEECDSDD